MQSQTTPVPATDRRDEARRQIREAVSKLMSEDGFQVWIDARSRFHRYSFGNVLLIAMQCPEATNVAGYKTWPKLGRHVRCGEKAIRILAPIVVKRDEDGEEQRAVVGFRSVCVFDVSQTDGDPLPEPPACAHPEGDDFAGYLPALEGHARELGYVVYRYRPENGALGFCDHEGRRIVVDPSLSPNAQVSTLVHELAHAHGLTYRDHPRAECEVIVEATTAIVLGSLGYDVAGFSVPYIAGWAQDEAGLDALERFASTIDQTARKIETALGITGGAA
jgi:hypothetical protein